MKPIAIYRNINTPDKFFGLELADWFFIIALFVVVFGFNREGLFLNSAILAIAYLALCALKRGRPAGYLICLLCFALSPRFKRLPDLEEPDRAGSYTPNNEQR